jgi:hypothetical protein
VVIPEETIGECIKRIQEAFVFLQQPPPSPEIARNELTVAHTRAVDAEDAPYDAAPGWTYTGTVDVDLHEVVSTLVIAMAATSRERLPQLINR